MVALLPKVKLTFDDNIPNDFDRLHIDLTVTLTDGRKLQRREARLSGWVGNPLTHEQRMKKFHSCARRVLPTNKAERIVAIVEDLEQQQNIGALMELLRAPKG